MRKIRRIFFVIVSLCLLVCSIADYVPRANAASTMAASASCVEFIKSVEGFSAQPYYDYNQYTVGYGTKCPTEKYFDYKSGGISKQEAEMLLQKELVEIGNTINQKFIDKYNLTLSQHQFDALVSFSFNIGTGWVTYDSTLRNAILRNASDSDMVYAFGLYCTAGGKYLPGLVTRRLCEANMYLNGIYSQSMNDTYGYVYYDANGGSVTYRVQGFIGENTAPAADAAKNGDVFLGWYTDLTGGSQVSTLNRSLTGKTLFARWQSSENTENQSTSTTTIKVTGDVVNIRSGPGTNYGIVKQIYRNETLTVSHVTHLTNMKWGKVQNGWICLDFTNYDAVISGTGNTDVGENDDNDEITVPNNGSGGNDTDTNTDEPQSSQVIVSGIVNVNDFLNIRSGPGTTHATVGFLFRGTKVSITEQRASGSTVWGRIEKGWICMDYIITDAVSNGGTTAPGTEQTPEKEPQQKPEESIGQVESTSIKGKITADALRIRSGAGTANPIVGFYYQNDSVVVSEKVLVGSVYWGKTNRGWISLEYVLTDTSGTEPVEPSSKETKTVIGDCLRIRKDAGTNYKIVGFLYYGDTVTVLETKDVDGTAWGRVDQGWICMTYVQ